MSYRRFVDPDRNLAISVAECKIACNLGKMGVTQYESQKPFHKLITTADFYFPDVNMAVFIDGQQIHNKRELKDADIDMQLKARGVTVRRYSYKAPITKKRLDEICDSIVDDVKGLRKMKGLTH